MRHVVPQTLAHVPTKWTRFADKGHAPRLKIYSAFRIIVDHEVIHYEQDAL
jgi:hypothetical protein